MSTFNPIRFTRAILAAGAGCLLLAGCSGDDLSRSFGITRDTPDEFTVTTRAPLSMPPDLDLKPPTPGAPRPQEQSSPAAAEAALAPETALRTDAGQSAGKSTLVADAGRAAPRDIRTKVAQDAAADAPSNSLTDQLLFWRKPAAPGVVVDPAREAARIRENAALGQNVQSGDTPIIQPSHKGVLDGIF